MIAYKRSQFLTLTYLSISGTMRAVTSILFVMSLFHLSLSIRCYCSGDLCSNTKAAEEEDCTNHLGVEYIKANMETVKAEISSDLRRFITRYRIIKKEMDDETFTFRYDEIIKEVQLIMEAATLDKYVVLLQLTMEINKEVRAIESQGLEVGSDFVEKMRALLADEAVPEPVDRQFCVTFVDGEGNLNHGCGVVAEYVIDAPLNEGCNISITFDNLYINYCRCDADLCNNGNITITDGMKYSKASGLTKLKMSKTMQLSLLFAFRFVLV